MKALICTTLLLFSASCTFTPSQFSCEGDETVPGKKCVDGIWITLSTNDVSAPDLNGDMGGSTDSGSDTSGDVGPKIVCGNGLVEGNEECDGTPTQDCADLNFAGGQLTCTDQCTLDKSGCEELPTCGNGSRDEMEVCEGEDLNNQSCQTLGFDGGTVSCTDKCVFDSNDCFKCGDGVKNGSEDCDGDDFGDETCPENGVLTCSASCEVSKDSCYACGDGGVQGNEICDGDDLQGQTCASQDPTLPGGDLACNNDCAGYDTSNCKAQYVQVSAGEYHTCAVKSDESVVCWGRNNDGRATAPSGNFSEVHAGKTHTCGLKSDNTILCWGSNIYVWNNITFQSNQSIAPSGQFVALSVGDYHNCALDSTGSVTCWGENGVGQADLGTSNASFLTLGIGLGDYHSCGTTATGVICSGRNSSNQSSPPAGVFKQVAGGLRHTCGIKQDDTLECWGNNSSGQRNNPAGQFKSISAYRHTNCAIDMSDDLHCWGSQNQPANQPKFKSVTVGRDHVCGIDIAGTLICWGENRAGQTNVPAL